MYEQDPLKFNYMLAQLHGIWGEVSAALLEPIVEQQPNNVINLFEHRLRKAKGE